MSKRPEGAPPETVRLLYPNTHAERWLFDIDVPALRCQWFSATGAALIAARLRKAELYQAADALECYVSLLDPLSSTESMVQRLRSLRRAERGRALHVPDKEMKNDV